MNFHLPTVIPLAPQIRLVQDDRSYITLQEIYEEYTRAAGFKKDDPIIHHINRIRDVYLAEDASKIGRVEILNLKTEIMQEIAGTMIPDNILSNVTLFNLVL